MLAPLRDNARRQSVVVPMPFPAPVQGWDTASPLAGMEPLRAVQLLNWFPQPGYLELRRGWRRHAKGIVSASTPVESLLPWNGPASSKMFAAGGGSIYDATIAGTVGTADVTGLSEDRWQWTNMTTSAGAFLFIVNGTDDPRHYNGTTWATPTITGSGYSATDSINVNLHKKRIWLIQRDSTKAFYLATDAVAGTATAFELGNHFSQGGYLVAMATWTLDAGTGPDDLAVFISSKGQVAIYQGTDPASADTWAHVGTFDLAPPIGRRCWIKYGNNPLLITTAGILQLSLSVKADKSQLIYTAITQRIAPTFAAAAKESGDNFGWQIVDYPKGTRLVANIPTAENSAASQYVMNTVTGAWCEFDGHDANCWLVFNDDLYFGNNAGWVCKADVGSADYNEEIYAVGQTAYTAGKEPGRLKRFVMVMPLILTQGAARISLGISADFRETTALSTPTAVTGQTAIWGNFTWGDAVWGGSPEFVNDWTSTPALGRYASVKFTARTTIHSALWGEATWASSLWGTTAPELTLQVNGFSALAEPGGFV